MAKPDPVKDAIDRLDWQRLEHWLKANQSCSGLVDRLKRARNLVLQWGDTTKVQRRDAFLHRLVEYLASSDVPSGVLDEVRRLVEGGPLFELAYRNLRSSLAEQFPDALTNGQYAWALLGQLGDIAQRTQADFHRSLNAGAIDAVGAFSATESGGTWIASPAGHTIAEARISA